MPMNVEADIETNEAIEQNAQRTKCLIFIILVFYNTILLFLTPTSNRFQEQKYTTKLKETETICNFLTNNFSHGSFGYRYLTPNGVMGVFLPSLWKFRPMDNILTIMHYELSGRPQGFAPTPNTNSSDGFSKQLRIMHYAL